MAKSQKIHHNKPKTGPIIYDERPVLEPQIPQEHFNPATANAPIRTVNFVEVGDMVGAQLQLILQRLNSAHDTAKGGIHYFLPVRHGKIGSDIVFEEEWLSLIKKLCIVNKDGEIEFKEKAKEVTVVRLKI